MLDILDTLEIILCCPKCKAKICKVPTIITGKNVKEGYVFCERCTEQVGSIKDYKYRFINFEKIDAEDSLMPVILENEYKKSIIDFNSPSIKYDENWIDYESQYKFSDTVRSSFIFEKKFTGIEMFFMHHPWSGVISVYLDDKFMKEYDLYRENSGVGVYSPFEIEGLAYGIHKIEIVICEHKNINSMGNQIFLKSIHYKTNEIISPGSPSHRQLGNEGNAFPALVLDEISQLPENALILDAGGGKRQIGDDRYINFDYMDSLNYPDVFGDGHCLPFKDSVFDFVISQGVLEHTYNPFLVAQELYRVLKPAGKIYVDTAFIQPFHGVPHHYFNFTLTGLQEVFKAFNKISGGYSGNLSDILRWYFKDICLESKIGRERIHELLKSIENVDNVTSLEEKQFFSPVVYFWGYRANTFS